MIRLRASVGLILLLSSAAVASSQDLRRVRFENGPADALSAANRWKGMILALANQNPEPQLVERSGITIPLFVENYDWREQDRVVNLFAQLARDESPELWEELLNHFDDERYALTWRDNGPNARNVSVGDICRLIGYRRFAIAGQFRSNRESRDRPDIFLDDGIRDLVSWRKQRATNSLDELQLQVCENAISALVELPRIPEDARQTIERMIRRKIGLLKRSRKPIFVAVSLDSLDFFNADSAKRARKKLQQVSPGVEPVPE